MSVIVECFRQLGDRKADPIIDEMIVTESMARSRGKAYLDKSYYMIKTRSLRVPLKNNSMTPSKWITATDGMLGLDATKLKIKSASINISREAVWTDLTTETYSELVTT